MSGDQGASSHLQATIANNASAQQSGAGTTAVFGDDIMSFAGGGSIDGTLKNALGGSPLGINFNVLQELAMGQGLSIPKPPPGLSGFKNPLQGPGM